ncbi:major capsid protein [Aquabacterium sp. CECT 9606]|uniref:major capsid protein n=1 Tax=Aquabacterium sp. CECT 9606 TaxID=2845822 RepID=UPI001E3BACAB|nr:major capsid protein [Aquabacterium sp. CECT 9606]CAH0354782.1 hypothetical protein AQB9606_03938 [Aquabacterium sp. CECT 9606]
MNKFIQRGLVAAGALALSVANAAVPTNVSTAITEGGTDGATVAGLVLVAMVGIWVFSLMRKGMRG